MLTDTPLDVVDRAVEGARAALLRRQKPDGHWVFELEADATIPAEYVLLEHFLDRIEPELERKIGVYLRATQGAHGGWPLFHDGAFNISASVKAYFALKMLGDDPDAPHMRRAREAILAAGGAERTNVFTRAQLALFGEVPWRAVPVMPVELVLLPRWFPFHLDKVSYWSRTVIVPLTVLMARKPRARNPRGVHVPELFQTPPEQVKDWIRGPYRSNWGKFFKGLDAVLQVAEPAFPAALRRRAEAWAVRFVTERLNGEDGLGAIYPAMANTVMMFDTLGYSPDHPDAAIAWASVRKLLVIEPDRAYCQPCLSPVWDTGLAGHALAEAEGATSPAVARASDWLRGKQVLDVVGDWARARPAAVPGGWAFQYANPHYPDVDDTAVVGMLLHRQGDPGVLGGNRAGARLDRRHAEPRRRLGRVRCRQRQDVPEPHPVRRPRRAARSVDRRRHRALYFVPRADRHVGRRSRGGAGAGVAAARAGGGRQLVRALGYQLHLRHVVGAVRAECGGRAGGGSDRVRRAVAFLLATQRPEGGWGEDNESYADAPHGSYDRSNPSQTAWALLGLMAAGAADHAAVARGVEWLVAAQGGDGEWQEAPYTAVGFPRVFYLRYHGYRLFFPLFALARYRALRRGNDRRVAWGF